MYHYSFQIFWGHHNSQLNEEWVAVMEISRPGLVSRRDFMGLGLISVSYLKGFGLVSRFKGYGFARDYSIETTRPAKTWKKWCFSCRKIFDKKNIGSRSRILKVSVSNGQVSVLVSNDEDETTSLMGGYKSCNTNTIPIQSCLGSLTDSTSSGE